MNRTLYIAVFVASVLVLALGLLFLCAASLNPERSPLAIILLVLGAIGAGWSAWSYRKWMNIQPGELAAQITALAANQNGEVTLAEAMSAFHVPEAVLTPAFEELRQKGQCTREMRGDRILYVFPGLKEHKMVRHCPFCGSNFPVKQALQKCPNCGGNLEIVSI